MGNNGVVAQQRVNVALAVRAGTEIGDSYIISGEVSAVRAVRDAIQAATGTSIYMDTKATEFTVKESAFQGFKRGSPAHSLFKAIKQIGHKVQLGEE